jgi:thiol-disulfide isomerase/thioredoxin
MHRFSLFTVLLALAVVSACRPAAAPVTVGSKPISVNDVPADDAPRRPLKPLAEMNWTTFEGTVQKLRDYEGKVVILDFWATNCPPCIEEIPHLLSLQREYAADLQIVGLHVGDDEDRLKVPEFVERLKITYPLATPEDELSRFVFGKETAIPQTAIFGRDGKFIRKIVGFNPEIQKELDAAVASAIKQ